MAENVNVKITMNGGGEIELELYPDVAPERPHFPQNYKGIYDSVWRPSR